MSTASDIAAGVADRVISPGAMSSAIANTFNVVSGTRDNLRAGFDAAMIGASQNIGACVNGILDLLESELVRACQGVGQVVNTVDQTMAAQIAATNGVLGLCNQRILRCQKNSTIDAVGGTIPSADAASIPPPPQSVVGSPDQATDSTSTAVPANGTASSSCPEFSYPPPPPPEVLDTLVLLHVYGGGVTPLSSFPPELWDAHNDSGVFFSLLRTPLTRGKIMLYRSDSGALAQTGDLYFNVGFPADDAQLSAWVMNLNMPPGTTETWTTANAYIGAMTEFGCNVVNREWNARGIPLPIVQDCPPDAADALCGGVGTGDGTGDGVVTGDGTGDGSESDKSCIPICGITPGTGIGTVLSKDLFPNLDFLNPANWPGICDLFGRVTRMIGIDGSRLWPCVTMEQMARNVYGGR